MLYFPKYQQIANDAQILFVLFKAKNIKNAQENHWKFQDAILKKERSLKFLFLDFLSD